MARSHTQVSRVEVWHSGKAVYALSINEGSVAIDADANVRRSVSATLVDPTGNLTRGDVGDLLNPYECEVAVYRGVRTDDGDELAPQGVFGLTSRKVADTSEGVAITITGQDRTMGFQGPMDSALSISAGTPVEEAIARLLGTRDPGVTLNALKTGFTCGPLLFSPDINVWDEAASLAASVGGVVYHDRTGQATFALSGPASPSPVAAYGEDTLLTVNRSEDSDTIRNVVVAESTNGLIRVVVEDSDPSSPTYARGRRRRPAPLISPHFGSVDQARQAAAARLAYELGRSETVSFTATANPAQDVQENITVNRPRLGMNYRGLSVATVTMPLGARADMTVGCRRSTLAMDGRVLPLSPITS